MKDYFIIIVATLVLIFACVASYKMGYASAPTKYIKCENGTCIIMENHPDGFK
ncbi:MAG: hypothetical protein PHO26_10080 [Dehalococcoidia bacterium]|nr:hypothetical protein [Dehalococcoidia bacterium]MDD5494284.1 hypothetical protein [Dehalococcoidia bacterium]